MGEHALLTIMTIGVYGFDIGAFLERRLREVNVCWLLDVRQRRGVWGTEYAWPAGAPDAIEVADRWHLCVSDKTETDLRARYCVPGIQSPYRSVMSTHPGHVP